MVNIRPLILIISLVRTSLATPDFKNCLTGIRNNTSIDLKEAGYTNTSLLLGDLVRIVTENGLLDSTGKPPRTFDEAISINYTTCNDKCGETQEAFNWSSFSQDFSSWLLPWLALVSQLPFGSLTRLDNLISVLLTIGSPTLAGYSLTLTVLNSRWISAKFKEYGNEHNADAAQILDLLQQVPLEINSNGVLLASLIVLDKNDKWWRTIKERLNSESSWSIAAATNITWVIIAYVFTVADSFTKADDKINSNGQSWLLSIVVGWLFVPVSGRKKLEVAIEKANEFAYVARDLPDKEGTPEPCLANEISEEKAISVLRRNQAVYGDEQRGAPIFNYARVWGWVAVVEEVGDAFERASNTAHRRYRSGSTNTTTPLLDEAELDPNERFGSEKYVRRCCGYAKTNPERRQGWGGGALKRAMYASLIGIALQGCTNIAAVIIIWSTPTKGIACRSGLYILYGIFSTIVWFVLVISSMLGHYHSTHAHGHQPSYLTKLVGSLSVFLRHVGTLVAILNTIVVLSICVFQFSNIFNNCYCDSSVLSLGSKAAYNVVVPDRSLISTMKKWWGGSLALGVLPAGLYVFFIVLVLDR